MPDGRLIYLDKANRFQPVELMLPENMRNIRGGADVVGLPDEEPAAEDEPAQPAP